MFSPHICTVLRDPIRAPRLSASGLARLDPVTLPLDHALLEPCPWGKPWGAGGGHNSKKLTRGTLRGDSERSEHIWIDSGIYFRAKLRGSSEISYQGKFLETESGETAGESRELGGCLKERVGNGIGGGSLTRGQ